MSVSYQGAVKDKKNMYSLIGKTEVYLPLQVNLKKDIRVRAFKIEGHSETLIHAKTQISKAKYVDEHSPVAHNSLRQMVIEVHIAIGKC